jgi:glycosyltransferase involved in cell wall biosynthesis
MRQALLDYGVGCSRGDTMGQVIREVRQLMGGADVVHVHMTAAELAVAVASWPQRAVPVVTTRHFPLPRGRSRRVRIVAGLAASRLKAQISISQYVAEHIEGPSTVVYPGVDVQPDATPAGERDLVLLAVQRLEPEKDTAVAITAFAESGLAKDGWRLEIAGDGSLRNMLAKLTANLGVSDSVRFLGRREDVPQLMARSAMLIAPCAMEGLGLSVLEAMAAGLPTVACATGGHLETLPIEGRSVCFPAGDISAAVLSLRRLATDAALREQLARSGQQRQRTHFTLQTQVSDTDAVYRGVLAGLIHRLA